MGANDYNVGLDGRLYRGDLDQPAEELLTRAARYDVAIRNAQYQRSLARMHGDYMTAERIDLQLQELVAEREGFVQRATTLRERSGTMLKGTGYIVIDPTAPRFDGEEITDLDEAKGHASNIAYKSGVAIVYMPVAVLRPERPTVEARPSKLIEQFVKSQQPPQISRGLESKPAGQ